MPKISFIRNAIEKKPKMNRLDVDDIQRNQSIEKNRCCFYHIQYRFAQRVVDELRRVVYIQSVDYNLMSRICQRNEYHRK